MSHAYESTKVERQTVQWLKIESSNHDMNICDIFSPHVVQYSCIEKTKKILINFDITNIISSF